MMWNHLKMRHLVTKVFLRMTLAMITKGGDGGQLLIGTVNGKPAHFSKRYKNIKLK